ncbi:MAG: hypothetical protein V1872_06695 [bacterium]
MSKTLHGLREELRVVEFIEQAIFLIRSTLPTYGWIYYLSTIPFIIVFINFWGIMCSSLVMPFEISKFAIILTLLLWVKTIGQSLYCKQLLSRLKDERNIVSKDTLENKKSSSSNNKQQTFYQICVQGIFLHPITIILLIISSILTLPFGYTMSFSQYLFIVATEPNTSIFKNIKGSYSFATQEVKYQHLLLLFLTGLTCIVFMNIGFALFFIPQLLKIFFNYETILTQSTFALFNTTSIMIIACLTYLTVDPIIKGCYVKLYFHLKSRSSGEDIMAECAELIQQRSQKKGMGYGGLSILLVVLLLSISSTKVFSSTINNNATPLATAVIPLTEPINHANTQLPSINEEPGTKNQELKMENEEQKTEEQKTKDKKQDIKKYQAGLKKIKEDLGDKQEKVDYNWLNELIKRNELNEEDIKKAKERVEFIKNSKLDYKSGGDNQNTQDLSRTISKILNSNDLYRWRYKDKKIKEEKKKEDGIISTILKDIFKTLSNWVNAGFKSIRKVVDRISDFLKKLSPLKDKKKEIKGSSIDWGNISALILIIIVISGFFIGIFYLLRQHKKDKIIVLEPGKKKIPDLLKEEVDATELKEDEWLDLKKELIAKEEFTLALRSAFLAILSFLHGKNYLVFEQHKTNYNYLDEIRRTTRNKIDVVQKFQRCIVIFERAWYGKYQVTPDVLQNFEELQEGIFHLQRI